MNTDSADESDQTSYLLEVCVDNICDALLAEGAGADRIEFCRDLDSGGVTPEFGEIDKLLSQCSKPVVILVRARAGDFVYSSEEKTRMLADIELLSHLPIAGIAAGALTAQHSIDVDFVSSARELTAGKALVMHRAFDNTPNHIEGALLLADLGLDRILTAGGVGSALDNVTGLSNIVTSVNNSIEILVAGGVRSNNAENLLEQSGASQIHSSARTSPGVFSKSEVIDLSSQIRHLNAAKEP